MDIIPQITSIFGWITWDPNPDAFTLPILDRPIRWYGIFWVSGFVVGYFVMYFLFSQYILSNSIKPVKKEASALSWALVDRMTWYVILGAVVGARLGHVLFYDWSHIREHPLDILKVWEGGLASHGGAVGTLIGVWLYHRWLLKQIPSFSFVTLLDMMCIPTAFVGTLIRIGNFFNQEISGTASQAPWAVQFLHPYDGYSSIPRHPVQLYEAAIYFLTFIVLSSIWILCKGKVSSGKISGIFFLAVFGGRFLVEPFKAPLGHVIDESFLSTGQLLSVPFICLGLYLMCYSLRNRLCALCVLCGLNVLIREVPY